MRLRAYEINKQKLIELGSVVIALSIIILLFYLQKVAVIKSHVLPSPETVGIGNHIGYIEGWVKRVDCYQALNNSKEQVDKITIAYFAQDVIMIFAGDERERIKEKEWNVIRYSPELHPEKKIVSVRVKK